MARSTTGSPPFEWSIDDQSLVSETDGFEAPGTLDRLSSPALGVTHYVCVPQMARTLRAAPGFDTGRLAGLTGLFTGGAPNPPDDIRA